ncbi:Tda2p ASCRUDRAFT_67865 [Ascoidea rubescens DSM 1968]|uniref:Uncharacterized protein n=1 Tax=Ascoidea rubescens DSM 1968 TaxID=1344418 RepID=A0A1D2VQB9_9ASCO|nr:hypothetical protein ASCRUDRAFT_67865 [Ascoidea rubescens DSM 1968]ODV63801.1 hypothetical protein ASCRUDRAFT_67865 [Ascoidea rubescens DSM 1968]
MAHLTIASDAANEKLAPVAKDKVEAAINKLFNKLDTSDDLFARTFIDLLLDTLKEYAIQYKFFINLNAILNSADTKNINVNIKNSFGSLWDKAKDGYYNFK